MLKWQNAHVHKCSKRQDAPPISIQKTGQNYPGTFPLPGKYEKRKNNAKEINHMQVFSISVNQKRQNVQNNKCSKWQDAQTCKISEMAECSKWQNGHNCKMLKMLKIKMLKITMTCAQLRNTQNCKILKICKYPKLQNAQNGNMLKIRNFSRMPNVLNGKLPKMPQCLNPRMLKWQNAHMLKCSDRQDAPPISIQKAGQNYP